MIFDWHYAWQILPQLALAAIVTIKATFAGYALAIVLGLVLALARRDRRRWIAWPTAAFIEFVRSTPLLVQLYFMYFLFPQFGLRMSAFTTGLLGLGLHYSAYTSEVYRAGLDGIPRGQWEASVALNLSPARTYWDIVIPQAVTHVLPVLGNYLVAMFKETPLLSAIAVVELMQTAKILGSDSFRYIEPITLVGVFFLVLSLLSAAGIRRLEIILARRPGGSQGRLTA